MHRSLSLAHPPKPILLFLSVLAACQSRPQATAPSPAPIEVLPQEVLTTPVQPDEKIIAQELRSIEAAFARRSCPQVVEHERRLSPLRKGKLTLPASTQLAFAVCESEADRRSTVKAARAVELLTDAQKNLVPTFSYLLLEELKADAYEGVGDKPRALESKKRMREYIASLDKVLVKVNADILALSDGEQQLSAAQRTRYQEALKLWPQDDRLFDALRAVDELLAEVVNSRARAKLLDTRTLLIARIEEAFAEEATLVESRLREGREPEAKEQAAHMRQRFPRENYGRRIDALIGVAPAGVAGSASAPAGVGGAPSSPAPTGEGATPVPGASPAQGAVAAGATPPEAATDADAAFEAARRSLDAGHPEESIRTLDSLPEGLQNDRTRRLRRESVDTHVRNVRTQVRNLYNRASATSDSAQKGDFLRECRKLLTELLARFPDAPGRSGIERNLRTINQDLEGTAK